MKFFIFFAAFIAAVSASGLYNGYGGHGLYGVPVVTAPVHTRVYAAAIPTSVTSRVDTYGAKVIAAPYVAAPLHYGYGKGLIGGLYNNGYYNAYY